MSGKFENVIIVTDLDGTYIAKTEDGEKRNREKIEYFKANGGHFTFATGRNIQQILNSIPDAAELVNHPIICCNGAYLYDLKTDRELVGYTVTPEAVMAVVEKFNEFAELPECCGAGSRRNIACRLKDLAVNSPTEYKSPEFGKSIEDIRSLEEWEKYRIYKCVFVGGEGEETTAIRKKMDPIFQNDFSILQASPKYYEYHAKGVSKGAMISEMISLVFAPETTIKSTVFFMRAPRFSTCCSCQFTPSLHIIPALKCHWRLDTSHK